MGRLQLASHQSKQQKMLDKCSGTYNTSLLAGNSRVTNDQCIKDGSKAAYALLLVLQVLCLCHDHSRS